MGQLPRLFVHTYETVKRILRQKEGPIKVKVKGNKFFSCYYDHQKQIPSTNQKRREVVVNVMPLSPDILEHSIIFLGEMQIKF